MLVGTFKPSHRQPEVWISWAKICVIQARLRGLAPLLVRRGKGETEQGGLIDGTIRIKERRMSSAHNNSESRDLWSCSISVPFRLFHSTHE